MNGGGGINNLPPHPNSRPRFIKGPFPSFLPCQIGIGLPPPLSAGGDKDINRKN